MLSWQENIHCEHQVCSTRVLTKFLLKKYYYTTTVYQLLMCCTKLCNSLELMYDGKGGFTHLKQQKQTEEFAPL